MQVQYEKLYLGSAVRAMRIELEMQHLAIRPPTPESELEVQEQVRRAIADELRRFNDEGFIWRFLIAGPWVDSLKGYEIVSKTLKKLRLKR